MKRKSCPPGVFCVKSNELIIVLLFIISILIYYLVNYKKKNIPFPSSPSKLKNNFPKKRLIINDKMNKINKINNRNNPKFIFGENKNNSNIKFSSNSEKIFNDLNLQNNIHNNIQNDLNNLNIDTENLQENTKDYKNVTIDKVIYNYKPDRTSDYLVNKDRERIINPLLPPERRNSYIDPYSHYIVSDGVPINIPTRGPTGDMQQIGALYKVESSDETIRVGQNTEPVILPLFGSPTHNGSNKWIYYTSTDKFNQIKLPLKNKNRECNSEYGCDELYSDDKVEVPAYNGDFVVKKYEFDKPRYLPTVL